MMLSNSEEISSNTTITYLFIIFFDWMKLLMSSKIVSVFRFVLGIAMLLVRYLDTILLLCNPSEF